MNTPLNLKFRVVRSLLWALVAMVAGLSARADDEYYGGGDVNMLPPFEVNGNDPATFDWAGYYNYLYLNNIDWYDAPDPFSDESFQNWTGGLGPSVTNANLVSQYEGQDLDGSCIARVTKYVLSLLNNSRLTEADIRNKMAQNGGFSATEFATNGISRTQAVKGLAALMSDNNISMQKNFYVQNISQSDNVSETTRLGANRQRQQNFIEQLSQADAALVTFARATPNNVMGGHAFFMQYDSSNGKVNYIDPGTGAAGTFDNVDVAWEFLAARPRPAIMDPNYMITFKKQ